VQLLIRGQSERERKPVQRGVLRGSESGESGEDAAAGVKGTEEGGKVVDDIHIKASDCFEAVSQGTKRDIERTTNSDQGLSAPMCSDMNTCFSKLKASKTFHHFLKQNR
jgi:hypothetical protein